MANCFNQNETRAITISLKVCMIYFHLKNLLNYLFNRKFNGKNTLRLFFKLIDVHKNFF